MGEWVARIHDLSVHFGSENRALDEVSLEIAAGECVALVGPSGAGKSLTASALLGLLPAAARPSVGLLEVAGINVRGASPREWRSLRGRRVTRIEQDALSALDPLQRLGSAVAEPLAIHRIGARADRSDRSRSAMIEAGIADPRALERRLPHRASGGQRQRALIASAVVADPTLIIADEPTTALDAEVRRGVLERLRERVTATTGILLISHDLAAVAAVADRVLVMSEGRIVEQGPVSTVLRSPSSDVARRLLAAAPRPREPRPEVRDSIVLAARGVGVTVSGSPLVSEVDLELPAGRTVGIVGPSGSGKTTLARALLALVEPSEGTVELDGAPWSQLPERARRPLRHRVQWVDQDPRSALDSRWSIGRSIAEAWGSRGRTLSTRARSAAIDDALAEVGLEPRLAARRPSELSGGQRQRATIARALAANPDVLVCDEAFSALDLTVQADLCDLLDQVQASRGLAIAVISHDLALVARLADEIVVLDGGRVVERGPARRVLEAPAHPVTRTLVAASFAGA